MRSGDNGAFMLANQWQSRHPLIADKAAVGAHSSTKFSQRPKNRRRKKRSVALRLLIESAEMEADGIVKTRG